MNIAELKLKIISNELPSLLVFTGEETGILNIYLSEICKKFNGTIYKIDTVLDAINKCTSKSIICKNKLFIVSDDESFLKNEKAWDKVKNLIGSNILILKYHSHDARLSFWKKFANETVIFNRLGTQILAKHLMNDFGISLENAIKLGENCDNDFIRCKLELEKVKILSELKNIKMDEAFEVCLKCGVLCFNSNSDIFMFCEKVLQKDFCSAIKIYNSLFKNGEPSLKIISVLYQGFKNVLIAQTMSSAKNIQQNAGISYYSYVRAKEISGYYKTEEIENILYILMNLEQGIKKGTINTEFAIDFFISNL